MAIIKTTMTLTGILSIGSIAYNSINTEKAKSPERLKCEERLINFHKVTNIPIRESDIIYIDHTCKNAEYYSQNTRGESLRCPNVTLEYAAGTNRIDSYLKDLEDFC